MVLADSGRRWSFGDRRDRRCRRRRELPGHQPKIRNSAALTEEALALALAAQRRLTALSGQQNSGGITFNGTLHARARDRRRPAWSVRRLLLPAAISF